MELLLIASLVAAFIAGIAALFAPCCLTVLLPIYLGSIFRQKITVLLMTFVFFLGISSVFLPLGLGIAGLANLFREYHNTLYIIGGIFLLALGIFILLGKHFSLPFSMSRGLKAQNAGSVFGLGVFSGFATLCCAPVLAGVLALAALPGSLFWGGVYALTYALGMVAPLFLLAIFLDKTEFNKKFIAFKKQISYTILGKKINLTLADIVAGLTFLLMGALILYLALTGKLAMRSDFQITINIFLENLANSIEQFLSKLPI